MTRDCIMEIARNGLPQIILYVYFYFDLIKWSTNPVW
jgi:hypothetical protein